MSFAFTMQEKMVACAFLIYQENKSAFVEFKSAEDREDIDALISTNLKAYYTIAVKWYEAK